MGKKYPERMCAVCRTLKPKRDLLRVVRTKEGKVFVDETGKQNGRGAYVCKSRTCIERCIRTKLFHKLFGCEVDAQWYESLKEYIVEE